MAAPGVGARAAHVLVDAVVLMLDVREPGAWRSSVGDGRPGRPSAGVLRHSDQNAEPVMAKSQW
jgi:hypothetical protein